MSIFVLSQSTVGFNIIVLHESLTIQSESIERENKADDCHKIVFYYKPKHKIFNMAMVT